MDFFFTWFAARLLPRGNDMRLTRILYSAVLSLMACESPSDLSFTADDPALYPCMLPDSMIGNRRLQSQQGYVWTFDDEFAAIAREVRGFGGAFMGRIDGVGREGTMSIYLVPGGDEAAARNRFGSSVNILTGRYDWLQLQSCYIAARNFVVAAGIHSTDIQETKNRIVYGAKDSAIIRLAMQKLAENKIPPGMVLFKISLPPPLGNVQDF